MRDHEAVEALSLYRLLERLLAEWVVHDPPDESRAYCVNFSGSEVRLLAR